MSETRLGTIVFAHDHVFHQSETGELYARGGQYSAASWPSYLRHCAQLRVVARCAALSPLEDLARLTPSTHEGVQFVPVPSLAGAGKLIRNRGAARATVLAALRGADLVIARLPSQTGLLAIEAAQALGKPWAVECVGCAWDAYGNHSALQAKLYAPLARQRMRAAIDGAAVVNYVTEQFLQRRYPTRGVAVACSDVEIEVASISEVLDARNRRSQVTSTERRLRFGLIGSFAHAHKGVDVALHALARARDQLPLFELCVLGPGDPAEAIALAQRLGLAQCFKADAAVPRGAAVQAWLDQIDVYLQPSRYEAMPRALIEAMARGCPALASDTGGIAELLPAACLHAPGDQRRLTEQLIEAVDPVWQQAQARRNIEQAQRFDRGALAAKREIFWQAITDAVRSTVAVARAP